MAQDLESRSNILSDVLTHGLQLSCKVLSNSVNHSQPDSFVSVFSCLIQWVMLIDILMWTKIFFKYCIV